MPRPDTIAVEDFLRPPERTRATVSPDGAHANDDERTTTVTSVVDHDTNPAR